LPANLVEASGELIDLDEDVVILTADKAIDISWPVGW
jgi:hypothetical protein